jgi:hypothetical protein
VKNRAPLFQIRLDAHEATTSGAVLPNVELRAERTTTPLRGDLEFFLQATPDVLRGVVVYDHRLFDQSTVVGFLHQYRRILEIVSGDPTCRISQIEELLRLDEEERTTERASSLRAAFRRKFQTTAT